MPDDGLREVKPLPDAEDAFLRWIAHLDAEFTRHHKPELRSEIVRDELHQLYLGRPHGGKLNFTMVTELAGNVLQLTLDPRNATLETEYSRAVDEEKYAIAKPLIWFWHMFDRSPVGLNLWLGLRFRSMLARHIFKHVGENVRMLHGVEFTYGYNLTIEENCTLHRYVRLDDREEIVVREGSILCEYATIGSDFCEKRRNGTTEIGPRARIGSYARIAAGSRIGADEVVEAKVTIGGNGSASEAG